MLAIVSCLPLHSLSSYLALTLALARTRTRTRTYRVIRCETHSLARTHFEIDLSHTHKSAQGRAGVVLVRDECHDSLRAGEWAMVAYRHRHHEWRCVTAPVSSRSRNRSRHKLRNCRLQHFARLTVSFVCPFQSEIGVRRSVPKRPEWRACE